MIIDKAVAICDMCGKEADAICESDRCAIEGWSVKKSPPEGWAYGACGKILVCPECKAIIEKTWKGMQFRHD